MNSLIDYAQGAYDAMENWLQYHLIDNQQSWQEWESHFNFSETASGIMQSYNDIATAETKEDMLIALEWVSHLDHCSGNLMHDYGSSDLYNVLNQLEQYGLEKTFPKWQSEVKKLLNGSRPRQNLTDLPSIEDIQSGVIEYTCNGCDESYSEDELTLVGKYYLCSDCLADYTVVCAHCNNFIFATSQKWAWDAEEYHEVNDHTYCGDCYADHEEDILSQGMGEGDYIKTIITPHLDTLQHPTEYGEIRYNNLPIGEVMANEEYTQAELHRHACANCHKYYAALLPSELCLTCANEKMVKMSSRLKDKTMNTYKVTIVRGKIATVIMVNASNSGRAKASAPIGVDGITEVFVELVYRFQVGYYW